MCPDPRGPYQMLCPFLSQLALKNLWEGRVPEPLLPAREETDLKKSPLFPQHGTLWSARNRANGDPGLASEYRLIRLSAVRCLHREAVTICDRPDQTISFQVSCSSYGHQGPLKDPNAYFKKTLFGLFRSFLLPCISPKQKSPFSCIYVTLTYVCWAQEPSYAVNSYELSGLILSS